MFIIYYRLCLFDSSVVSADCTTNFLLGIIKISLILGVKAMINYCKRNNYLVFIEAV